MAEIVTRETGATAKGSPLTNAELDANFININTELATLESNKQDTLSYMPEDSANKGIANGYAGLDGAGKVPSGQLPSYVDDVLEYASLASFPVTGETGKIYVAIDTTKTYRWSGSVYVAIAAGAVDSVNGYTGVVSLTKSDVGLSNVDNTADTAKPISTATQTALDGKSNVGHGHAISDVTSLQTTLDNKSNVGHGHGISDVSGLQTALDGKSDVGHGHTISNVTGLQTALDGKAATAHNHVISDVTNLQTTLDGKASSVHTHIITDVTGLQTALDGKQASLGFTPENSANKGINNGYASLDSGGKVPSSQLPSYVDDVLEYANLAALPATGETGKIYITLDTNKTYRWSGSVYTAIGSGTVESVNSMTGVVILTKTDVGLGNVDNTSDANKPVSTATQTALDAKVTGPASVVDNAIPRYDGTTGKLIQTSDAIINDSGQLLLGLSAAPAGWGSYGLIAINGTNGAGFSFSASGVEKGVFVADTNAFVIEHYTGTIRFLTGNADRFTINAAGAFGLGGTPSYGTTNQVLISNGNAAVPAWSSLKTINGTSILGSGDITTPSNYLPLSGGTVTAAGLTPAVSINQTSTGGLLQLLLSGVEKLLVENDGTLFVKTNIKEVVYPIVDGAAVILNPVNGGIQTWTLGATRTPTCSFEDGESLLLCVDDGSAFDIVWTSTTFGTSGMVWKTDSGVAPTLNLTGYTFILLWKVGTQVYGARVGDA